MGSLQRLSNRSLGSTSCRQFPTLVLPLALLFPRTVWALRDDLTFQFEQHAKEKAANLLTVQDSDWPCTRNNFTSIHERIGNHSSEQLVRIRCHEPLLLLVQRDLLMIRRLKEIMNSKDFEEKKFPANFISDEKRKKLIWSTIETAANAVGFGLHGAPALADNIIFNGAAPMYDYAKYALELKHEKKANATREQAKNLFDSAGKKVSSYFSDMLLGMLYDLYAKMDFTIKAVGEGGPMITTTTAFEDEVGNPLQWNSLGAGTPLHLNPDPKLQKEGKTAVSVSGNWYVRGQDKGWISIEGWVDDTSVSTKGGFLRWKGSKHLQACKEMQEPCRSKDQAVSIQEGQLFKVVTLAVSDTGLYFWQLAGGIGFVPWFDPYKKNMEGPLPSDEATAVATELEKTVTLPSASDMASFKGLSKFNHMWGSKPAQTSKVVLGGLLFIGGIFTHGLLWIAASAYGVAAGVTDAGLTMVLTELLSSHVGYVLLALANFEKELFAGRTSHQTCRPGSDDACAEGFACVGRGVFQKGTFTYPISNNVSPTGKCVKSPQRQLMPLNEVCSVDIDCASGICNLEKSGSEIARLLGKCGQDFE